MVSSTGVRVCVRTFTLSRISFLSSFHVSSLVRQSPSHPCDCTRYSFSALTMIVEVERFNNPAGNSVHETCMFQHIPCMDACVMHDTCKVHAQVYHSSVPVPVPVPVPLSMLMLLGGTYVIEYWELRPKGRTVLSALIQCISQWLVAWVQETLILLGPTCITGEGISEAEGLMCNARMDDVVGK